MKKLSILLLLVITLFGCQPYYVEPTEPNLTGGAWTFIDYDVQVISSISDVEVIYSDTICVNNFGLQRMSDDGIVMSQDYEGTSPDRRFIKGQTLWEFDDNSFSLYIDGYRFPVTYPNYMMREYDKMKVTDPYNGAITTYSFYTNAYAKNYPTKMVLTSPNIVTDLYLSNGMRDKAVTVQIIMTFMRN